MMKKKRIQHINYKRFKLKTDCIAAQECEVCHEYFVVEDKDIRECCPSCGGALKNFTEHEGTECMQCNQLFEAYEPIYVHKENRRLCSGCYELLEKRYLSFKRGKLDEQS